MSKSKWIIFVPDEVLTFTDKKVLIIDDLTNSGETIEKLTQHLIDHGISSQNLFSMTLIANVDVLSRLHIHRNFGRKLRYQSIMFHGAKRK